jgi:hypothetical protein
VGLEYLIPAPYPVHTSSTFSIAQEKSEKSAHVPIEMKRDPAMSAQKQRLVLQDVLVARGDGSSVYRFGV